MLSHVFALKTAQVLFLRLLLNDVFGSLRTWTRRTNAPSDPALFRSVFRSIVDRFPDALVPDPDNSDRPLRLRKKSAIARDVP